MTFSISDAFDREPAPLSDQPADAPDPPIQGDSCLEDAIAQDVGDQCDLGAHRGLALTFHCCRQPADRGRVGAELDGVAAEHWTLMVWVSCPIDDRLNQTWGQPLFLGLTTHPMLQNGADFSQMQWEIVQTVRIDLHLSPDRLQQFDIRPLDLWPMLAAHQGRPRSAGDRLSAAMILVLQQMLSCSFAGSMRQMYLEEKSVELLTLWLQHRRSQSIDLGGCFSAPAPPIALKDVDRDRIYQARDILLQAFRKPPSLKELAHQVGLNDCTLKRQFKQVFGTTVFGYLYDYRMEQARRWLLEQPWSVTEVARRVGYKNLCAFSTAFRKKFGVSPRSLQRQGGSVGDR
jgi:AraC-like DNA-binding protein